MLDDMFHRLSSRFTADTGTEGGNRGDIGKQPRNGGCGRERGGTGIKPGSVTADGTTADKKRTETVTCRVGSERSPCPVLMRSWRQEADVRWECDVKAATNWDFRSCKNSPARLLFFAPVLMRRRSLRLPSPGPFPNSDGNTGAFFRAENYHREFSVPKTGGPNAEVFAIRVIFSGGLVK